MAVGRAIEVVYVACPNLFAQCSQHDARCPLPDWHLSGVGEVACVGRADGANPLPLRTIDFLDLMMLDPDVVEYL